LYFASCKIKKSNAASNCQKYYFRHDGNKGWFMIMPRIKQLVSFFSRRLILVLILLALVLSMGCSAESNTKYALSKPLVLPVPTGIYGVGKTQMYFTDATRTDLLCPDDWSNLSRTFTATVYYPVQAGTGTAAPYVSSIEAGALTRLTQEKPDVFDSYSSHAVIDGIIPESESYPVLIFSCGGGEAPQFYASLIEEIASQGFIIFSLSHAFDAPVTVLEDGSIAYCPRNPYTGQFVFQNALTKKAVKGNDAAYDAIIEYEPRPADIAYVLSQLDTINATSPLLQGTLDTSNIGVFGHSLGGAASVQAGLDDPQVDRVAVLDSYLFYIVDEDAAPLTQPVLMIYSDTSMEDEPKVAQKQNTQTTAYLSQTEDYSEVTISGIGHLAFMTDYMWVEPLFANNKSGKCSELDGTSAQEAFDQISGEVIAFFAPLQSGM
jgi:dienelactone hydrolase